MKILSTLFLAICMIQANAQITTDRPDQSESGFVVPKGVIQLEAGYSFSQSRVFTEVPGSGIDVESNTHTWANPLLRLGIFNGFELRAIGSLSKTEVWDKTNDILLSENQGWNPIWLGAKVRFFESADARTGFGILGHTALDKAWSDKDILPSWNTRLALSHGLNDILGLGANLGLDAVGEEINPFASLALGISSPTPLGGFVEVYGSFIEDVDFSPWVDAGLTYLLSDFAQMDLSFGLEMFPENDNSWFISTGFAFKIPEY